MGRKRVISEEQVLDAAEHVVVTKGAGQLTIEGVALRAGISKASVLYHYKTKAALIKAVVDRIVSADAAINEAAINSLKGGNDAVIRGRILAASEPMTEGFRSVALNLSATVANAPQLRRQGKDSMKRTVERIRETSEHPRGAMLAFLAMEGVKLLELVDWHTWTESERKLLLKDIEWLIQTNPRESGPRVSPKLSSADRTDSSSQTKRRKNSPPVCKHRTQVSRPKEEKDGHMSRSNRHAATQRKCAAPATRRLSRSVVSLDERVGLLAIKVRLLIRLPVPNNECWLFIPQSFNWLNGSSSPGRQGTCCQRTENQQRDS